ncbi:unnamed protein product [Cladocopium goreaui]|uniref:Branched-chain-amino-acid transaminase n=1 Tax=Cladocopium goreaui TaxID=2562237 RepID=A0A9P1CB49_9DINO|nr:unnamed protein product [Cladocopium goreaui]
MSKKEQTVGGAALDWGKLVFGTRVDTHCYIKHVWKDGAWDEGEMVEEPYVKMHVLANVFHYGQAIFEGQKVFHCKDGKVRIFNDKMNHIRMSRGAERMGMPTMSLEMFQSALTRVTLANLDFVPPYGSGASLYLRPFMVGSGPQLGLGASSEFTFIVVVAPVGPYYGSAVPAIVVEDYDRAAPNGVGQVKCAGNYAADIVPAARAKKQGFPVCLYLDAKEHRYVEEFSTSNFVAITKSGVYLTPDSVSVLDSVTNASLEKLAVDMGLKVERRKIDFDAEVDSFKEVGAVGTGVVITVIESITRDSKVYKFEQSEVLQNMYNKLRAIQTGDEADVHGWMRDIA